MPPTNASGTDAIANGPKSRQRKCPARTKATVPTSETAMLSTSAVGFIATGLNPDIAITAS